MRRPPWHLGVSGVRCSSLGFFVEGCCCAPPMLPLMTAWVVLGVLGLLGRTCWTTYGTCQPRVVCRLSPFGTGELPTAHWSDCMVIVALGPTRLATLACRAFAEGILSAALATAWQIGRRHGCRWSVYCVGLLGTCAAACSITCSCSGSSTCGLAIMFSVSLDHTSDFA